MACPYVAVERLAPDWGGEGHVSSFSPPENLERWAGLTFILHPFLLPLTPNTSYLVPPPRLFGNPGNSR